MVGDIWYRYKDVQYAPPYDDDYGSFRGTGELKVELDEFIVVRETPKGAWIASYFKNYGGVSSDERFVRHSSVKKYAYPTLDAAKQGFVARKKAQLRILNAGVSRAQKALRIIENLSKPDELFP